jgi:hypothetical protein
LPDPAKNIHWLIEDICCISCKLPIMTQTCRRCQMPYSNPSHAQHSTAPTTPQDIANQHTPRGPPGRTAWMTMTSA